MKLLIKIIILFTAILFIGMFFTARNINKQLNQDQPVEVNQLDSTLPKVHLL